MDLEPPNQVRGSGAKNKHPFVRLYGLWDRMKLLKH